MSSLTAQEIALLITALASLLTAGLGFKSARETRVRLKMVEAELERTRAETGKLKSDGDASEAEVMLKLAEAMKIVIEPLNAQVKDQAVRLAEQSRRIDDLQRIAGE